MRGSGRALFVAGAGTEIGKTYVTAALTRRLRAQGRSVRTLKPLASGVPSIDDPAFALSDTGLLLLAQGLPITPETVAACSPWRFLAPLAPDLAAAREGRSLTLAELVAWCEAQLQASNPHPHPEVQGKAEPRRSSPDASVRPGGLLRGGSAAPQDEGGDGTTVLIEGVGGLMSPITPDATGLDWLKALRIPALLVTGSYLGAISHALTALETLRAHGVAQIGLVVSESLDAPVPPEIVAEAIGRHSHLPITVLRRGRECPDALAALLA